MKNQLFGSKPLLFFVLLFTLFFNFRAQAHYYNNLITPIKAVEKLDIVRDFGADPTGNLNSHQAFESAAAYINHRHGFVDLSIPAGIYKVGKQTRNGKEKEIEYGFKGFDVFALDSCSDVSIHGFSKDKTIIKIIDGLKYGSFDLDGKRPKNPEEYNWYAHRNEKGFNLNNYYLHRADIGHFFRFNNCKNISLHDLELNGNANKYDLGGSWSDKGRQIDADGIMIVRSEKLQFTNLTINEMGRDGLIIIDPDTKDTANLKTNNIIFKNIEISHSGRNGISWCGGNNLEFTNCNISFTGYGSVKSAPLAGIDIEPEGSVCKNGKFINCKFINNFNSGLISDRGETVVKDCYNMNFINCKFSQSAENGYVTFLSGHANSFQFNNCQFYGLSLNAVVAQSEIEAAKYNSCIFQDCYNGAKAWNSINNYLIQCLGTHTVIDNCVFNHYNIAAIAIRGNDKLKCNEVDESSKTIIKNSTFNSYLTICSNTNCPPNGSGYAWRTRFFNNKFNFIGVQYLIDMSPGCTGTGNTDLGNGFNKLQWPQGFVAPKCTF